MAFSLWLRNHEHESYPQAVTFTFEHISSCRSHGIIHVLMLQLSHNNTCPHAHCFTAFTLWHISPCCSFHIMTHVFMLQLSHYDTFPLAGLHLQYCLHHLCSPVLCSVPRPAAEKWVFIHLVVCQVTVVQRLVKCLEINTNINIIPFIMFTNANICQLH